MGDREIAVPSPRHYYILFYSILFYSILFYSILFYSILFYSILFYSILFYSILFYSILFSRTSISAFRKLFFPGINREGRKVDQLLPSYNSEPPIAWTRIFIIFDPHMPLMAWCAIKQQGQLYLLAWQN